MFILSSIISIPSNLNVYYSQIYTNSVEYISSTSPKAKKTYRKKGNRKKGFLFKSKSFNSKKVRKQSKNINIIDGDTVKIRKKTIRLACIDAPELKQKRGANSANALKQLIGEEIPTLYTLGKDHYGRTIGILDVKGKNINVEMVKQGHAFIHPKYLSTCPLFIQTQLTLAETRAKQQYLHIWQDNPPQYPWLYRNNKNNKIN